MSEWWKIMKAPPPWTGASAGSGPRKWQPVQIDDIPGFRAMLDPAEFPLARKIWRDTVVDIYPIEHGEIWNPSLHGRHNALMLYGVYNLKTKKMMHKWEIGRMNKGQNQDPREEQAALGELPFRLTEYLMGVQVIYETGNRSKFIMEGNVLPETKFYEFVDRHSTHDAETEDYNLTNGAAAALAILAHHARKKTKRAYKERQQLFIDFGLGPLSRDTDSKYIEELVGKGLMRREKYHRTPNMANYPVITPKGKVVANRFDMPTDVFMDEFKDEVRRDPDGDFNFHYMDPTQFGGEDLS